MEAEGGRQGGREGKDTGEASEGRHECGRPAAKSDQLTRPPPITAAVGATPGAAGLLVLP